MSTPAYIYALHEPYQPWNIRYIGKTYRNLGERLTEHVYEARVSTKRSHRLHWIRSLQSKGQRPGIVLVDIGDEDNWIDLEVFYIASHRLDGFNLVNDTPGGENPPNHKGRKQSPEHIAKTAAANRKIKYRSYEEASNYVKSLGLGGQAEHHRWSSSGDRPEDIPSNPHRTYKDSGWIDYPTYLGLEPENIRMSRILTGRVVSEETGRKISLAKTGQKLGPQRKEVVEKRAAAHRGMVRPEETRERISAAKKGKPWSDVRRAAYEAKKQEL